VLTGAERVGRTIKSSSGTWTSIAPLTFAYQWVRCQTNGSGCADIAGATASSYRLRAADAGRRVHVRVTASGADGSAAASSAPSGAVARPHVKPRLTITAPARMSLAAFLRGVRATVRSDRAASMTVQLAAHATGAHISRAYNLVLVTKRATLAKRGTKTLRLRPSRKLVGSAQRFSVQLVVTARGAGGDVSTKRKRIRVR
jgi:hypothetical protein